MSLTTIVSEACVIRTLTAARLSSAKWSADEFDICYLSIVSNCTELNRCNLVNNINFIVRTNFLCKRKGPFIPHIKSSRIHESLEDFFVKIRDVNIIKLYIFKWMTLQIFFDWFTLLFFCDHINFICF